MTNDAEKRRREFGAQDFRFTTKGDTLYAIGLEWSGDGSTINIRSLATGKGRDKISSVNLLGHDGTLAIQRTSEVLRVRLPSLSPCNHAFVLKVR